MMLRRRIWAIERVVAHQGGHATKTQRFEIRELKRKILKLRQKNR
jgi:hypothetical protein